MPSQDRSRRIERMHSINFLTVVPDGCDELFPGCATVCTTQQDFQQSHRWPTATPLLRWNPDIARWLRRIRKTRNKPFESEFTEGEDAHEWMWPMIVLTCVIHPFVPSS